MTINWQVRGVDDEAIRAIKNRAKQRGLSVGQFLNWHFNEDVGDIRPDSGRGLKTYRIQLLPKVMLALKYIAASHGLGVAQYLTTLTNKDK